MVRCHYSIRLVFVTDIGVWKLSRCTWGSVGHVGPFFFRRLELWERKISWNSLMLFVPQQICRSLIAQGQGFPTGTDSNSPIIDEKTENFVSSNWKCYSVSRNRSEYTRCIHLILKDSPKFPRTKFWPCTLIRSVMTEFNSEDIFCLVYVFEFLCSENRNILK